MFCKNCGGQISESANFCRKCGTKVIKTEPNANLDVPKFEVQKAKPVPRKKIDEEFNLPPGVSIVAGTVTNMMDDKVCPFCEELGGNADDKDPKLISADDPDYDALQACNFHPNCKCMFVYILSDEKDIEKRELTYKRPPDEMIKKYAPYFWARIQAKRGK